MVDFSGLFGAALSGLYQDATLHRRGVPAYGAGGEITTSGPATFPCKAQIDSATMAMRSDADFVSTDMRVLVLRASCSTVPTTDDQLSIETGPWAGTRWSLQSRSMDPGGAAWEMRGRQV